MSNSYTEAIIDIPKAPTYWHGLSLGEAQWEIHNGDALEVLKELPDEFYNCIITSPPYFWLRDYGVDGQIGLEQSVEDYVTALNNVMTECQRVLRKDGVLFLNMGDTYYSGKGQPQGPDRKHNARRFGLRAVDKGGGLGIGLKPKSLIGIPWRVALEMTTHDWALRSTIIWHREHCLPEPVRDRPRRSYEYVFLFTKHRKYHFDREALIETGEEDMWTISARPKLTNGIQTAPFPDELVQRCLDIGCPEGGAVLDPFAGAGTTLRVAISTGRPATGIELNPEFCQYMVRQLNTL